MFNTMLRLLIGDTTPHGDQFYDAVVVSDEVNVVPVVRMSDVETILGVRDPSTDTALRPVEIDGVRYVLCYDRTNSSGPSSSLATVALRSLGETEIEVNRIVVVPSVLISVFDNKETDMTPVVNTIESGAVSVP